jgi:hypothetical protein
MKSWFKHNLFITCNIEHHKLRNWLAPWVKKIGKLRLAYRVPAGRQAAATPGHEKPRFIGRKLCVLSSCDWLISSSTAFSFKSSQALNSLSHSLSFETRSSRSYKSPLDLNLKTSTNLDFTKWLHSSTWSVSVSDRYFCFFLFCFCSLFFSPVPPRTVIKHSLKPNSFLLEEEC